MKLTLRQGSLEFMTISAEEIFFDRSCKSNNYICWLIHRKNSKNTAFEELTVASTD